MTLEHKHGKLRIDAENRCPRQYTGLWYKRMILGEWCLAEGAVYEGWDPDRHIVGDTDMPAIGRGGDHNRAAALPDTEPGTRRPPQRPNNIAIGDSAALVHRTDHVHDVDRTGGARLQRPQGKRCPTPT